MRKILMVLTVAMSATTAFAQSDSVYVGATATHTPSKKKFDLSSRGNDHVLVQLANNFLLNAPDSISSRVKGFSRSANVYVMLDKPFKSDNRFSVAIGAGIGVASFYTKNLEFDLASNASKLPIYLTDSTEHYKKYKLTTSYLEAPVELRFSSNPAMPTKSVKAALGVKVGTMLSGSTKGKVLQSTTGDLNNSIIKVKDKDFINKSRIGLTARVGYGIASIFGAYYFSPVFRDGTAPNMKSMQIGITLSGL